MRNHVHVILERSLSGRKFSSVFPMVDVIESYSLTLLYIRLQSESELLVRLGYGCSKKSRRMVPRDKHRPWVMRKQ